MPNVRPRVTNSQIFKARFQTLLFMDPAWVVGFASVLGSGGAERRLCHHWTGDLCCGAKLWRIALDDVRSLFGAVRILEVWVCRAGYDDAFVGVMAFGVGQAADCRCQSANKIVEWRSGSRDNSIDSLSGYCNCQSQNAARCVNES